MCIVRVDGGAIGSDDCNRMRGTNSQGRREGVCEGRLRLAGLSTPPSSLSPTPFPALHKCRWVVPAMYG